MEQDILSTRYKYPAVILILALSYALYAVKCVWLAFANDYMPFFALIMNIPLVISFTLGIVWLLHGKKVLPKNLWLLILPLINLVYPLFHSYEEVAYGQIFFTYAICSIFVLFPDNVKVKIFDLFYWIILISNIFSIIFFICYQANVDLGFQELPYYSKLQKNALYIRWLIFAIFENNLNFSTRLCGIFNEPGALGTVSSLLFVCRYNHSRKWEKFILLVTILFTYSLAGFIIVLGFYFFILLKKNPIFLFFLILGMVGLGFVIVSKEIGMLAVLILRFVSGSDNRTTDAFDNFFTSFLSSSDIWLGVGHGFTVGLGGVLSIKEYILCYGVIGAFFLFCSWFIAALNEKVRMGGLFVFFFFLSLYQRPKLIENIYGFVLLFGGLAWIRAYVDKKMEIKKWLRKK